MLDINFVRNNIDLVKEQSEAQKCVFDVEKFNSLDRERREYITHIEALRSQRKKISKLIGKLKRDKADTSKEEAESKEINLSIEEIEEKTKALDEEFRQFLLNIPNSYDPSVPVGQSEEDNLTIRTVGEKPKFNFTPKAHWDLSIEKGGLDFDRAAKIAGSRFSLYKGIMAKLERVLINFMLDNHTLAGYEEIIPPFIANEESLTGTGNLPKFREDLYKIEGENYYLIPTAEVPLTNIYRGELLKEELLPLKYVAYTPCFRSEAGSHGRDVRGLVRLHQFNKVELLKFTDKDSSFEELDSLTNDAENILQKLGLHYRVSLLCTGDLSFSSSKTYDIEVWMPSRNGYMEISSCSNFVDFQARRLGIKYKDSQGKKHFVHTLNGSGVALGRTVAAILENYQQEDGSVLIPEILRPFFGSEKYF